MSAQVIPPPGSEVPIPPKPKTDSPTVKPDSIKPPFGRSLEPNTADIGPQYSWNREQMFASGALSLADLLERIPGALSFRSGWIASPKFVTMGGDAGRVRVYYDGVELDNLDARTAPLLDLNTVQLWTLESVKVLRLADELRVYVRSWRTDRTSPYTRTDVSTGNEDTNLYRGYYGKRFGNGAGLQLAGEQHSTVSARFGGGGDGLSFLARVGAAGRLWSVDGFANRANTTRVLQPTFGNGLSLPPYAATYRLAYLRGAFGKVGDGPWIEAIASSLSLNENSKHNNEAAALAQRVITDTTDTASSQTQFVIRGGFTRDFIHASASDRVRSRLGTTSHSPEARVEFDSPLALLSASAESDGLRDNRQADVVFRLTPIPYLALAGAFSRTTSTATRLQAPADLTSARLEAGVRLLQAWLSAGVITRDTAVIPPLRVFDSAYVAAVTGTQRGFFVALRGKIIGDLGTDIVATHWDSASAYLPRYQARSEISLDTRWLSRFPSGSFGLRAVLLHEYRGDIPFPTSEGLRLTAASNVFSGLLEIRILRGVLSYQVRNMAGLLYQVVPDFYMPRVVNLYGIRWEFWN